jgi:hypothetical protein
MTEWMDVRQQAEEWERRKDLRRDIAAHFPANFKISVSGGPDAPVNTPLSFHITVSDLDENAIRTLAAHLAAVV